jgi:hypothetical protein
MTFYSRRKFYKTIKKGRIKGRRLALRYMYYEINKYGVLNGVQHNFDVHDCLIIN